MKYSNYVVISCFKSIYLQNARWNLIPPSGKIFSLFLAGMA